MPIPTPSPTPFNYSILTDGFYSGLWDTVKIMWPVFPLIVALALAKAWIAKNDKAEREAKRQARVYDDERRRERARQDERRDQQNRNR